jgi:hypothetical protein
MTLASTFDLPLLLPEAGTNIMRGYHWLLLQVDLGWHGGGGTTRWTMGADLPGAAAVAHRRQRVLQEVCSMSVSLAPAPCEPRTVSSAILCST